MDGNWARWMDGNWARWMDGNQAIWMDGNWAIWMDGNWKELQNPDLTTEKSPSPRTFLVSGMKKINDNQMTRVNKNDTSEETGLKSRHLIGRVSTRYKL